MVARKTKSKHTKFMLATALAVALVFVLFASSDVTAQTDPNYSQTPLPCSGPCIVSNINATEVILGDSVTVTGRICPAADNVTVRVAFTRPDYSWIDCYALTDNQTGEFTVTHKLDMAGFWNIFPIYGHINDRLYANVTDPTQPDAPLPTPNLPPFKIKYPVLIVGIVAAVVAGIVLVVGTRRKTRKISSIRLFVQIAVLFLLFFGVFIDHHNLPVPAAQIAPHDFLFGANEVPSLPDGLPLPVFGCYYACGRTFTCPLWQLQTYIYPFWDVGRGWSVDYMLPGLERIAIVMALVIVAAVLLGRFWCGWICPFGLFTDLMTKLRKALHIKHRNLSASANEKLHQLSYIMLAAIIIISVVFASQTIFGTQLVPETETGGFTYTYFSAPFCQVCPMKPLCILTETGLGLMKTDWTLGTTTGQFWQLGQYITSLNLAVLAVVVAATFFFRRSWCRICPLGALIALFNRFPPFKWISGVRLEKAQEKCTKCGICKRVCPTQVTEVYEAKGGDVATSQCILCLRCVEMCPEKDCLKFKFAGQTVCKSRDWTEKA